MFEQVIDDAALRIRHRTAMDMIEELRDEAARIALLVDVIAPRRVLLEASLERAASEQRVSA